MANITGSRVFPTTYLSQKYSKYFIMCVVTDPFDHWPTGDDLLVMNAIVARDISSIWGEIPLSLQNCLNSAVKNWNFDSTDCWGQKFNRSSADTNPLAKKCFPAPKDTLCHRSVSKKWAILAWSNTALCRIGGVVAQGKTASTVVNHAGLYAKSSYGMFGLPVLSASWPPRQRWHMPFAAVLLEAALGQWEKLRCRFAILAKAGRSPFVATWIINTRRVLSCEVIPSVAKKEASLANMSMTFFMEPGYLALKVFIMVHKSKWLDQVFPRKFSPNSMFWISPWFLPRLMYSAVPLPRHPWTEKTQMASCFKLRPSSWCVKYGIVRARSKPRRNTSWLGCNFSHLFQNSIKTNCIDS